MNIFLEKLYRKYTAEISSRPLFNFIKQPEATIASKKLFCSWLFLKRIIKIHKKYHFSVFFKTWSSFMDLVKKNERGLDLVTSLFSSCQAWSEVFFYQWFTRWPSLMFQLKIVSDLLEKVYLIICASKFMMLKLLHLLYFALNLRKLEKKGSKYENWIISRIKRAF